MTEPKYCKDCKHSRPDFWEKVSMLVFRYGEECAVCLRYSNGAKTLCRNERLDYKDRNGVKLDTCGTDAKYYEARK